MTGSAERLIWTADDAREWIAVPTADPTTSTPAGVLGVITGSHDYPGAAVLGVEAAARTGVGMIRYTGRGPSPSWCWRGVPRS